MSRDTTAPDCPTGGERADAQGAPPAERSSDPVPLPSPRELRDRVQQLIGVRRVLQRQRDREQAQLDALKARLELSAVTTGALEHLGDQLFGHTVRLLEEKLTIALQEVLQQPLRLKAECRYLRGAAAIEFSIERDGHREDILKGQGGSVANVLSVGLRMFALTALDPARHRRFLVLDEQDCWLRPDLVPRLARIVEEAGSALGFQVIFISHHDTATFYQHAERIYRFEPNASGIRAVRVTAPPEPSSPSGGGAPSSQRAAEEGGAQG